MSVSGDYTTDATYQSMLSGMVERGIAIGHGTYIQFWSYDGVRAGIYEMHKRPDGLWCCGTVTFKIPQTAHFDQAKWTVNSMDPLDLSPSIQCRACDHHGFIQQGKWVPA